MVARPASSRGALIGSGLLLAAGIVSVLLGWSLIRTWPGPSAAVLFIALAVALVSLAAVAYYLLGLLSLRYEVSRDGLVLHWAASRTTVPMSDITHILQGRTYAEPLRGLRWSGHEIGRTILITEDGSRRELLVLATVPPELQLIVVTPDVAYALSPHDRSAFVREVTLRRRMGPVQQLAHGTQHPLFSRVGLANDSNVIRLLAAALCVNALAFSWLIWHYPTLPAEVALWYQFDAVARQPTPIATQPLGLAWQLPLVGVLALALNTGIAVAVHSRTRLGSIFLALGALALQLLVFVTLLRMAP